MLCACIDIGSNTTRLLVAEVRDGRLRHVLQERAFTRLGAKGGIGPEKVAEVARAVAAQARVAREAGAERIRTVGTHAIRQADNQQDLVDAIEREAGVQVEVLSGEDEARLAFRGATHSLNGAPDEEVAVVDVGGGSTEVVCGTRAEGVTWSISYKVGSGYLADHYLHGDPPTLDELQQARAHAREVFSALDAPHPHAAYAVGGSATSLLCLVGGVLDRTTLHRAIDLLADVPADEIARRFELHRERVRLLPGGILLLDAAAEVLGAPLQIARGGLREGALLDDRERAGV